jgi:hypothetical protein
VFAATSCRGAFNSITSSAISINLRVAQPWRHLILTHAPLLDDPTIRGCVIAPDAGPSLQTHLSILAKFLMVAYG